MSFPNKPSVPAGATYEAHRLKMDGTDKSKHSPSTGPEYPVTAAARDSAVTEADMPGDSVLDHGEHMDSSLEGAMPVEAPDVPVAGQVQGPSEAKESD